MIKRCKNQCILNFIFNYITANIIIYYIPQIGNLPETLPLELIPPSMRATGVGGGSPQTVGTPNLPPRGSATLPAKQHPPRPGLDKVSGHITLYNLLFILHSYCYCLF